MEIIGLSELTDLMEVFGRVSVEQQLAGQKWFDGKVRSVKDVVSLRSLKRIVSAGAAIAALSVSTGHSGAGPTRTEPRSVAVPAAAGSLAPLAKATLDEAWHSAAKVIEAQGGDVQQMKAAAGAKINAWRAFGVANFPDTDEADEG